MRRPGVWSGSAAFAAAWALTALLFGAPAWAHCDGVDGPVVTEAAAALEAGDVTPVLKWVPAENEREIREAFDRTRIVRKQSPEARELADQYFFETLVRIHRASEGAPFTGLKPSGTPVAPGVADADAALAEGTVDALAKEIAAAVEASVRKRFAAAAEAQRHQDESVEAGRAFVARYVEFVHFVEHLHEAVAAAGEHGHADRSPVAEAGAEHDAHRH